MPMSPMTRVRVWSGDTNPETFCNLPYINIYIYANIYIWHLESNTFKGCNTFYMYLPIRHQSIYNYRFKSVHWPLLLTWISSYAYYKVWDEIIYPFPGFKVATDNVLEWINNFIQHFIMDVTTNTCRD